MPKEGMQEVVEAWGKYAKYTWAEVLREDALQHSRCGVQEIVETRVTFAPRGTAY